MNNKLYKLHEIFNIQSISGYEYKMVQKLLSILKKYPNLSVNLDDAGNILITKGKIASNEYFPCVCAHVDTVHAIVQNFKVNYTKTPKGLTVSSSTGIGGDDKNGIIAILELLANDNISALKACLFTGEENGCIGSSFVDLTFFNNVGYLIGIDRKGNSDFICKEYKDNTISDLFLSTVKPCLEKFNYKETSGLITDVFNLKERGINLSTVNLSCGYYNAHTKHEYIVLDELLNSINFTENLILTLGLNQYPHESTYTYPEYKNQDWWKTNKYLNNSKYNYTYDDKYEEEEANYDLDSDEVYTCYVTLNDTNATTMKVHYFFDIEIELLSAIDNFTSEDILEYLRPDEIDFIKSKIRKLYIWK